MSTVIAIIMPYVQQRNSGFTFPPVSCVTYIHFIYMLLLCSVCCHASMANLFLHYPTITVGLVHFSNFFLCEVNPLVFSVCMYVCVMWCIFHSTCMEGRGQLHMVNSFFTSLHGFQTQHQVMRLTLKLFDTLNELSHPKPILCPSLTTDQTRRSLP